MTATELPPEPSGEVLAHRAAWLAALRSGDYRQGTGALRVDDADGPTYCCLGVAEQLRGATWRPFLPPDATDDDDRTSSGSDATHFVAPDNDDERGETVLTVAGMAWLGVDESAPYVVIDDGDGDWSAESVTTLNDQREWPFARIADAVEAQREDWDGTEAWCEARLDELRLERNAAEFAARDADAEETS